MGRRLTEEKVIFKELWVSIVSRSLPTGYWSVVIFGGLRSRSADLWTHRKTPLEGKVHTKVS